MQANIIKLQHELREHKEKNEQRITRPSYSQNQSTKQGMYAQRILGLLLPKQQKRHTNSKTQKYR